jgi:hypothetical protein
MGNETVDNFKQSSLAAPAGADDANELVFADGQTHVRESLDLGGAVLDRLLEAF